MALNARKVESTGGNFKRQPALEAGTYPARLVQVICLGLKPQAAWQGNEKPPQISLHVTYELLDEFMLDEDGNEIKDKPRWQSETFPLHNLDSDMAKSTKRYFAIDPSEEHGGDWGKLVGTPVMVTITQNPDKKGKKDDEGNLVVYNNIASVQTMRDKDAKKAEPLVNEPRVFDPYEPDLDVYFSLPDWLRKEIKEALDFEGSDLEKELAGINEEAEVKSRREAKDGEQGKKSKAKAEEPESSKEEESDDDDW